MEWVKVLNPMSIVFTMARPYFKSPQSRALLSKTALPKKKVYFKAVDPMFTTTVFSITDYLLIVLLVICTFTDVRRGKIYNTVLLPGTIIAVACSYWEQGLPGVFFSLQGLALGIALLFFPFVAGGIGGGDVKLLGVVGAFKGPGFVVLAFLAMALIGGVMAILYILKEKRFVRTLKNIILSFYLRLGFNSDSGAADHASRKAMPYGMAIALGTMAAYFVKW